MLGCRERGGVHLPDGVCVSVCSLAFGIWRFEEELSDSCHNLFKVCDKSLVKG